MSSGFEHDLDFYCYWCQASCSCLCECDYDDDWYDDEECGCSGCVSTEDDEE